MTLGQTLSWIDRLLDRDLKNCLKWAFAILDKDSSNDIIITHLRQNILLLSRCYTAKDAKANLQRLQKTVSEAMMSRQTFDWLSFQASFQSSFKPIESAIESSHASKRLTMSQQGGNSMNQNNRFFKEPTLGKAMSHNPQQARRTLQNPGPNFLAKL